MVVDIVQRCNFESGHPYEYLGTHDLPDVESVERVVREYAEEEFEAFGTRNEVFAFRRDKYGKQITVARYQIDNEGTQYA